MNRHDFRKSDFIAIAGILMFAIVYAVDKLVYEMPKVTFIVLVAIAMVLLIVGAIGSRKNHGGYSPQNGSRPGNGGGCFSARTIYFCGVRKRR